MGETAIVGQQRHERFVQRVVISREIWGLKGPDGWAVTESRRQQREVLPFWSDRALANRCAVGEWVKYEATLIPFDQFIQKWLPQMTTERCLVGTNWTTDSRGHEIEPDALWDELARHSGHST